MNIINTTLYCSYFYTHTAKNKQINKQKTLEKYTTVFPKIYSMENQFLILLNSAI